MNKIITAAFKLNEKLVVILGGWKHIPFSNNNFMYLNPYIYKGKPLLLTDGTSISRGDLVAELHIDNLRIGTFDTNYPNLLKLLQEEITALGKTLQVEHYSKIKAVYGITVFHEIGKRQGFTVREINSFTKRVLGTLWENILRVVFKKENKKNRKKFRKSKECWLSKGQILSMGK